MDYHTRQYTLTLRTASLYRRIKPLSQTPIPKICPLFTNPLRYLWTLMKMVSAKDVSDQSTMHINQLNHSVTRSPIGYKFPTITKQCISPYCCVREVCTSPSHSASILIGDLDLLSMGRDSAQQLTGAFFVNDGSTFIHHLNFPFAATHANILWESLWISQLHDSATAAICYSGDTSYHCSANEFGGEYLYDRLWVVGQEYSNTITAPIDVEVVERGLSQAFEYTP